MLKTAVLSLLLFSFLPANAFAETRWEWPVDGTVEGSFRYQQATPFLRGQRRGIEIAAQAAATVRSACAGTVTYAGVVANLGPLVAVRCGDLSATYLHLGSVDVRRGDRVYPGKRIGRVGSERIYLGARKVGSRFGYIDPLTLLENSQRPPTVGVIPWRTSLGPRSAALFADVRTATFASRVNVLSPGLRTDLIVVGVGTALLVLMTLYCFTRRYVHTKIRICLYSPSGRRSSNPGALRLAFANSRRTSASTFTKRAWDRKS